jgi:polysaccharide biosynthesis transport protein
MLQPNVPDSNVPVSNRVVSSGLGRYLTLGRKWLWLIVLITSLGGILGYLLARSIPSMYRTSTTMLVGQLQQNLTPTDSELQAGSNLSAAYALLVQQPRILQATAEAIGYGGAWQDLFFVISATAQPQLLRISVIDRDPFVAQAIANEVANQLILQGPVAEQQAQAESERQFVQEQLTSLRKQILTGQKTIEDLTARSTLENDPEVLRDLNERTFAMQDKVDAWQRNYASLSELLNRGGGLYVTILAPANLPATPYSPNIPQIVILGALFGFALSCLLIYLLEYIDDTIKDAEDAQRIIGKPALGAIIRINGIRQPQDALVTIKQPRSPTAEAYRVLRTNLRYSGIENPSGVMLITSAGPGEGKSTTAANLAVSLAQVGKKIILVDADLRRPSAHKLFGLSNEVGLSDLFASDSMTIDQVMQKTEIETLRVITSGPIPPNPAEMLDSRLMTQILASLRQNTDLVIVDSPPVLPVADASILGSRCSGTVLVVDSGKTRTEIARRAVATLERANVNVVGVILNKMGAKQAAGYYYYYYGQKPV